MTIDGFLTFLGLMAAAFALLSPLSRQRIRTQIIFHIPTSAILLSSALILLFAKDQTTIIFETKIYGAIFDVTVSSLSFILVLIWLLTSALIIRFMPPTGFGLTTARKTFASLVQTQKYDEACDFLEHYAKVVISAEHEDLPIQSAQKSIEEALHPNPFDIKWLDETPKYLNWYQRIVLRCAYLALPKRQLQKESATEISGMAYSDARLIEHTLRFRPRTGATFFLSDLRSLSDGQEHFLRRLFADANSTIYREVERTQWQQSDRYIIAQECIYLRFFTDPMHDIERLNYWKPAGDHLLELANRAADPACDLNGPTPTQDDEIFNSKILLVAHFFEIISSEALAQDARYHYWVSYIGDAASRIAENLQQVTDGKGPDEEFSLLGHRVIYELLSILRRWIDGYEHLPADGFQGGQKEIRNRSSIIGLAIFSFSRAISSIICAQNLPRRFRSDRLESLLRTISGIEANSFIRLQLVEDLKDSNSSTRGEFFACVEMLRDDVDHIYYSECDQLLSDLE